MARLPTPSSVDYWFPPDELAAPHSHEQAYYDPHPHAPQFNSLEPTPYQFDQPDQYEPAYSSYPDPRQSFASVDTAFDYADNSQLDPPRGRSDSSASTQQSSIYTCSPLAIQAPLPLPAQAANSVYATPPLGQADHGHGLGSTRLVDSLERQAANQGRTVPGVSFGEPPKRLVVNTRLDNVAEEGFHSPQSFAGPSPLSQSLPASLGFPRKRGSLDFGQGQAEHSLPPTPKRFCHGQGQGQGQAGLTMPLTPDPTPSTYTLPGPAQPAYVYGLQSAPASAVPKAMGMVKAVSRTLSYGTQGQPQARPAGVPRSYSYDSASPTVSPRGEGQFVPQAQAQAQVATYTLPANSPRMSAGVGLEGTEQDGYFEFQPQHGPSQQQQHQHQQQRQRTASLLASPMSLPIDRGQFQHYPHLSQAYQSEPSSPYSTQLYPHPHPHQHHHSVSPGQFVPVNADGSVGYGQPHSPMTPGSRRGSLAGTAGFTPTQSALLNAASMNRLLAARAAGAGTGAGEDGRPTSSGMQYTLVGQPLHSPTSHPLSASHSAAPSPPLAARSSQGHIQPHAYPIARAVMPPAPLAGGGPVEGIHPRYRDVSPARADAGAAADGGASAAGDDKLHACDQAGCGKKFKRFEHLRRHERTHTQDRPYGCEFAGCGRWFSRSDNLTQHKKTHLKAGHGGEAVDGAGLPERRKV